MIAPARKRRQYDHPVLASVARVGEKLGEELRSVRLPSGRRDGDRPVLASVARVGEKLGEELRSVRLVVNKREREGEHPVISSVARVSEKLGDELRFIRSVAANPIRAGAVTPSSRALAELMVELARPDPDGFTLELGAGTGVVTAALVQSGIPAERLVVVEHDPDFCRLLRERFPGINVIQGDAYDLERTLAGTGPFGAALSSLPLLMRPPKVRERFVEDVLQRVCDGGRLVQFSYGLGAPIPEASKRYAVYRSPWVAMNFPPARVWTYRRLR
ncbi:class I SAM-dependent methyltransferase [Propylenella binzhouense]|uniref:Methyltransferase domain-containing protein n=1 Tax=Propylenella binzhouense TaxID=2555902 RepID=A0A964T477_9HYPH|nr:methyltransferase domain-containing protein [Propylenella binzhouense]MYZ47609.1 methyltransferase domain-containing protein [Propylenella binzhouense]